MQEPVKTEDKAEVHEAHGHKKKFYKMKYTINILPLTTFEDDESINICDLLDALGDTDELEVFQTKVVQDYFLFMWNAYAKHLHYFGGFIHLCYFCIFWFYVNTIYNNRDFDNRVGLCWVMLICLIYPMIYDCMQLYKQGPVEYFSDFWNYLD